MDTPSSAAAAATTEKDDPTIWRVDDALWALLEPVLRVDKARKKPGRLRRDDRAIFDGLVWLARTGPRWSQLPREFGPKSTVHERFSEWVETGAPERAWAVPLRAHDADIGLEWTWQAADGCIVKAPFGKKGALARRSHGAQSHRSGQTRHQTAPADRGRGIPTALVVTGANRHDMSQLAALLDGTVVEPTPAEPPHLALDRGYADDACRDAAVARGDTAHIPPPASEATPPPPGHPDRHPPRRWVVEVAHSWFNRFRRLPTRTEKQASHYRGFSQFAAVPIIYRKVRHARLRSG